MRRKINDSYVIRLANDLVSASANDLVKLAIPDAAPELIDSLDLRLLSEIKRSSNGVVEFKLINRLDAIALLAKLVDQADRNQAPLADSFFKAMDNAAGRIADSIEN